jgi:hypothetical protein
MSSAMHDTVNKGDVGPAVGDDQEMMNLDSHALPTVRNVKTSIVFLQDPIP